MRCWAEVNCWLGLLDMVIFLMNDGEWAIFYSLSSDRKVGQWSGRISWLVDWLWWGCVPIGVVQGSLDDVCNGINIFCCFILDGGVCRIKIACNMFDFIHYRSDPEMLVGFILESLLSDKKLGFHSCDGFNGVPHKALSIVISYFSQIELSVIRKTPKWPRTRWVVYCMGTVYWIEIQLLGWSWTWHGSYLDSQKVS